MCVCRYQGPLLEDGALETAVTGGAAFPEFTKLCAWLVSELKLYCKLEENVHATNCKCDPPHIIKLGSRGPQVGARGSVKKNDLLIYNRFNLM